MQKGVYSYNKTVDCAGPNFSSAPNQSHTKCRIPNFARTAGGRTPITRTVTKVGKKYFYIGNDAFSRMTGEYIDREECNGGYVLYPDIAAYEEAVRTADERSAIRKIVDADFYGYDPFSCWRTYTVSDAAVHEIYRILVECGAIKTSTEEGKPDGKSAE